MKIVALIMFVVSSSIWPMTCGAEDAAQLLSMLKAGDFERLESATKQIQAQFENGVLSEIELRNTYRPFYNLNNEDLDNIAKWKIKFPDSYAAHLIKGAYYKKKALQTRGSKFIQDTPEGNLNRMEQYFEIARPELIASFSLTEKPYLSVFHLLEITRSDGNHKGSLALLAFADKMLPNNTLVRNRFIAGLAPRWGGSYEAMRHFIARSKTEGLPAIKISQLEAIMYDDMGLTSLEKGDKRGAIEHFSKSFDLAQQIGGEFPAVYLVNLNYYSCREPELQKYCPSRPTH